jgi:hypothetical protein
LTEKNMHQASFENLTPYSTLFFNRNFFQLTSFSMQIR